MNAILAVGENYRNGGVDGEMMARASGKMGALGVARRVLIEEVVRAQGQMVQWLFVTVHFASL